MGLPIYHSAYTAAQIEALIAHPPRINSSTHVWEVWDVGASAYASTGIIAESAAYASDARASAAVATASMNEAAQSAALAAASAASAEGGAAWYGGIDLTQRYATEIAASPYNGNPWAWITARITAGNFEGIHINDYIPFATSNNITLHACVGGINTYKGYGDTAVGNHIDFICRELWPTRHAINQVNYNNGTKFGSNPATEYPWLASDLYLWLNSKSGTIANAITAGGGTGTAVDYTSNGVYYYLPAALKAVIVGKHAYLPKRYSASGNLTDDNGDGWADIGKLWLPSEYEVYGAPCWGGKGGYSTEGNNIQYPLFSHNMNRVKKRSGSRDSWWVLSVSSGNSTYWCAVHSYGTASYTGASTTYIAAPVCFRIAKD